MRRLCFRSALPKVKVRSALPKVGLDCPVSSVGLDCSLVWTVKIFVRCSGAVPFNPDVSSAVSLAVLGNTVLVELSNSPPLMNATPSEADLDLGCRVGIIFGALSVTSGKSYANESCYSRFRQYIICIG